MKKLLQKALFTFAFFSLIVLLIFSILNFDPTIFSQQKTEITTESTIQPCSGPSYQSNGNLVINVVGEEQNA